MVVVVVVVVEAVLSNDAGRWFELDARSDVAIKSGVDSGVFDSDFCCRSTSVQGSGTVEFLLVSVWVISSLALNAQLFDFE